MMNRIDAKTKAKALLQNRTPKEAAIFGAILLCCALPTILVILFDVKTLVSIEEIESAIKLTGIISTICGIISSLIYLFLSAGLTRSALRLVRGEHNVQVTDTVKSWNAFGKFFLVTLVQGLILLLWLLTAIAGAAIGAAMFLHGTKVSSIGFVAVGLMLLLISIEWGVFIGYNRGGEYFFAYFVAVDHPDMGVMDCLRESGRLIRGHKLDLFATEWSFYGWRLLDITFFARIFSVPYQFLTYAVIYEQLCGDQERSTEGGKRWLTEAAVQKSPVIEVISGEYAGSEFPLADGAEVRIGRDPKQANIVISPASEKISALHCGVRYDSISDSYIVTDYSTNGTYAGSTRLPTGGTRIKRGTVIKLATGEFLFRLS